MVFPSMLTELMSSGSRRPSFNFPFSAIGSLQLTFSCVIPDRQVSLLKKESAGVINQERETTFLPWAQETLQ